MRKILVHILCCFIPSRKLRHKIRRLGIDKKFDIHGKNNVIVAVAADGTETPIKKRLPGGITIKCPGSNNIIKFYLPDGVTDIRRHLKSSVSGILIKCEGNNNTVLLHMPIQTKKSSIKCRNDACYVEIGSSSRPYWETNFDILCVGGYGQRCIIGENTTIVGVAIFLNESAQCIIGADCMLSSMIRIWPTDGHSVLNADTGEVLNEATRPLIIEDHVWIGEGVRITKRAHIHKNSIVSGSAVAYKDYKESGVVIAGNPGEIVKRNITWERDNPFIIKRKANEQ